MREKLRLLKRVAHLYYEKDMNQREIAKLLGVSRPQISRMLTDAKKKGIVKITILDKVDSCEDLEASLKKYFNLKDAIVVPTTNYIPDMIRQVIGKIAANYLNSIVKNNCKIGVSWGISIYEMVKAIESTEADGIEVVQLIGGLGQTAPVLQSFEFSKKLANKFNGTCHLLHAPGITSKREIADSLKKDKEINRILALGKVVDIAIVGLDALWRHRSLVQVENLSEDDLRTLEDKKAVGQTCFRFYDIRGNICDENLNERVIGISLDELKKIDTVIGIATSLDTIEAIVGGLRSGFLDVLISDEKTVEEIIVQQEDLINNGAK
ncbi:MAG: hypothetical protein DRH33_04895 [Candidatus Nealsonbacteria bacterium]|nr:MAG: hypothetical protein DRH33_04895 [Candidatus Nealsonbacteria bacterium]